MENKKKILNKPVINVGEQEKQMMPKDFKNLPMINTLEIEPEILMMSLHSKQSWNDPDPHNLTSPEICAGIAHTWSNEYLTFYNIL